MRIKVAPWQSRAGRTRPVHLALTILLAALSVVPVVMVLVGIRAHRGDVYVVDVAGRQRMLSRRLTSEVLLALHGRQVDFRKTFRRIEETTKVLLNGGSVVDRPDGRTVTIPQPTSPPIRGCLERQLRLIERLRKVIARLVPTDGIGTSTASSHSPTLVSSLLDLTDLLVRSQDIAVKLLGRQSEANLATNFRWALISSFALILLCVYVAASAIHITFLNRCLGRQALEARLLYQTSAMAAETDDLDNALHHCLEAICTLTDWPVGHVYFLDESRKRLEPGGMWWPPSPDTYRRLRQATRRTTFRRGEDLPGRIWESGKPEWIVDVETDSSFPGVREFGSFGIRAAFGFPVFVGGSLVAVLEFFSDEPMEKDERLLEVVLNVGEQLGRVIERKRSAERLALANESLRKRNRELDEFNYAVSHDLHEPLRAISVVTEEIRDDLGDKITKELRDDFDVVLDASRRMQALIRGLLELARSGREPIEAARVALDGCVEDALDALAIQVHETDAIITRDELPEVWGDRALITQVYQNLIGNAIKFVRDRRPEIRITAETDGETPIFGVRDNGIGLASDDSETVFAPFRKLNGHDFGGHGIGLSICRRIVEKHGGRIWVESPPGEGCHFRFTVGLGPGTSPNGSGQEDGSIAETTGVAVSEDIGTV